MIIQVYLFLSIIVLNSSCIPDQTKSVESKISKDPNELGLDSNSIGMKGEQGPIGPIGPIGPEGKVGPEGSRGKDGSTELGKDGAAGEPGKDGKDGAAGEPGKDGPVGPKGESGSENESTIIIGNKGHFPDLVSAAKAGFCGNSSIFCNVFLQNGVYELTTNLQLPPNTSLIGQAKNQVFIIMNENQIKSHSGIIKNMTILSSSQDSIQTILIEGPFFTLNNVDFIRKNAGTYFTFVEYDYPHGDYLMENVSFHLGENIKGSATAIKINSSGSEFKFHHVKIISTNISESTALMIEGFPKSLFFDDLFINFTLDDSLEELTANLFGIKAEFPNLSQNSVVEIKNSRIELLNSSSKVAHIKAIYLQDSQDYKNKIEINDSIFHCDKTETCLQIDADQLVFNRSRIKTDGNYALSTKTQNLWIQNSSLESMLTQIHWKPSTPEFFGEIAHSTFGNLKTASHVGLEIEAEKGTLSILDSYFLNINSFVLSKNLESRCYRSFNGIGELIPQNCI